MRLTSDGLRALRGAHPKATYAAREGVVSAPVDGPGREALGTAERVIDALADVAALAA